jgi:hypothetical protein
MELTLASDITTEKVATSPGLAQLLDYLRRAKVAHRDEIATRVIGILHTRSLRMHRKVVSSSNPLLFAINPSTHKFSAWVIGRHDAPGSWCFHTSRNDPIPFAWRSVSTCLQAGCQWRMLPKDCGAEDEAGSIHDQDAGRHAANLDDKSALFCRDT